jgi:O-acetyl-ADP-ribose deacetylase (regulator of RNase III)
VYGYPVEAAAEVAVREVRGFPARAELEVVFCCFSERDRLVYERLLREGAAG